MKRLLNQIILIGSQPHLSEHELRKIKTSNAMYALTIVFGTFLFCVGLVMNVPYLAVLSFLAVLFVGSLSMLMNYLGFYITSRIYSFISISVLITIGAWMSLRLNRPIGIEYIIVGYSIVSVLYFDKLWLRISTYLFSVILFLWIHFQKTSKLSYTELDIYVELIIIVVCFVLLFAVALVFQMAVNESEEKVQEKNIVLLEQNSLMLKKNEQVEDLNKLKNKLFSIITHDIRGSVASLHSTMEAMQDGIITDEELKQLAPDLTKSVQHTMRLIENVFMWAKRQMEGEEVHWSLVDVSKIVYQKIEAVQIDANKKGISINNTIVGVQTFKTDGEMIDLILRNLLANSIKFCRPGDSITVAIETKETEWWLIVKDTGIGMTKEQLEKVSAKIHFTTFGTSNEKGSGLGLIIIRDFTNQLGGRFWVESEKDRGSCFYIALPHFVD